MVYKGLSYTAEFVPDTQLNYNKFYIGLKMNERSKTIQFWSLNKSQQTKIKVTQTKKDSQVSQSGRNNYFRLLQEI